jgi:hypothetical protein
MKLFNWAKEKLRAVSDRYERKQREKALKNKPAPKLAPMTRASTRQDRKEERWRHNFHRWASMLTGHGCPVLTGERLRKTVSMCSPANLTVLPKYPNRREV